MKLTRVLLQTAGGAAVLATLACSGSGSSVLPTAPTQRGATIQGRVEEAGAGASQGVRVSVMGTSLTALTDAAGRFTVAGVPAGNAHLRFEGVGIDALLDVSGLRDGQVLTLNVQVSGTQATVVTGPSPSPTPSPSPNPSPSPDDDDELEFRGRIQSIGSSSLVVDGRLVEVDANTLIRRRGDPIPFSALQIGNLVEVEGTPRSDGSVLARKITLEDDDDNDNDDDNDEDNDETEFKGTIQSIAPPSLVVAGRQVTTNGSTRILDDRGRAITLGDLRVGQTVEVEGRTQSGGVVLASKIKVEDEDDD
jgi:hypothetical protein